MVEFLPTILALILGAGLVFILSHFITRRKPTNLPNGSMGWPLLGETLAYLKPHGSNSMGSFLQEHCSRYGRVFKSHLFGSPTIVCCDYELSMFILQNEGKLFQASYPKAMHDILGQYGMFFVSGDQHKKQRNFVTTFAAMLKSKSSFHHSVEKLAISVLEAWKDCKEISFLKEVKQFTLNLMVKSVLSIEPEEPIAVKILEDFRTYMKGFISLPLDIPGSAFAKAVKARSRLASTVRNIMMEREKTGLAKGDFLDVILSKQSLNDEEIVSVVLDILLGGYETTSTLIALIVYFLGHTPTAFEDIKKEHETIRKSKKDGQPLDWEDYQKMEFTYNVMHEAMRCGNVVKFLHRKALQDVKYKEYFIPSGWKVLPVLMGAHFDPSLHENPFQFNPWRWTDKAMVKKMIPFGAGPRMCPGAELAKVEVAFFIHHLVLNYRWKVKPDDFPVAHPYVEFRRGLLLEIEPTYFMVGNKT